MSTYLPIYCFQCVHNTVRHGTCVIEWLFCTFKLHWKQVLFTVSEHKTTRHYTFCLYLIHSKRKLIYLIKIFLFACQNMLHLSLSKVHSQLSMFTNVHTVTINLNVTVHKNEY